MDRPQAWFWLGCSIEIGLLGIAAGLSWHFGRPLFENFRWSWRPLLIGLAASLPALAFFFWCLQSSLKPMVRIRSFLEYFVRPIFGQWPIWQLAMVSILAGIGEETLFRGAIQGWLSEQMVPWLGLAIASLLFGCLHLVTWTYALITAALGAYLGALWQLSGNLLVPIVTHAVYDLVALIYYFRIYRNFEGGDSSAGKGATMAPGSKRNFE